MINCVFFDTETHLKKLTGLNHEELWKNGFNLDEWDFGLCCEKRLNPFRNESHSVFLDILNSACLGYEEAYYGGKYYYIVYHS